MLTQKQKELLELLERCQKRGELTPSFDEMKDALGLQSKSGIHRLITALEERGHIRRLPNRARALEVVRGITTKAKQVISDSIISIPLYGRIAAGQPIEAMNDHDMIDIPGSMIKGGGEHYALKVSGDSMMNAGILDGDLAIIRNTKFVSIGKIVAALVDEQDATLKTFFKDGRNIRLEPANPDYETQIYPASRVQIQGQLEGIIRRY